MKTVTKRAKMVPQVRYVICKPEDCVLVVKVGSDDRPARTEDLANIAAVLRQASKDLQAGEDTSIITHHAIDFALIPKACLKNAHVVPHGR